MTIHQLYRNRMWVALVLGVAALALAAAGTFSERIYLLPAAMMAISAVITFRLARESYLFDRGESGPPEWRQLTQEATAWAENGYRTSEEIAAGAPPRQQPPETLQ